MDEITMFAELRPDDTLTDADLEQLRDELFPNVGDTGTVTELERPTGSVVRSVLGESDPVEMPRRRSRVAVAAAAVALLGVGGLWLMGDRQSDPMLPAPAAQTSPNPTTGPDWMPGQPSGIYQIPLIGFTEPGWKVTHASHGGDPARRAVVFLSDDQFDGPWVEVRSSRSDAPSSVPVGDGTVDVNGQMGGVVEIDDGVLVHWNDAAGNRVSAFGWRTDLDQVVRIARGATVTATGITLDSLPDGLVVADAAATDALGHHAEYVFTHADGREVGINLTPGGERGLYQQQGASIDGSPGSDVMIGDSAGKLFEVGPNSTPSTIAGAAPSSSVPPASRPMVTMPPTAEDADSPGVGQRAATRRDFWAWGFGGSGFESEEQFVELLRGVVLVEAEQREAALAENIVTPDQRAEAIDELLSDVPLPPGFDAELLSSAVFSEDRYQLIAEVSGEVVCRWQEEWLAAQAVGDGEREQAAIDAIASSRDWLMLHEIADQGGWSESIWSQADSLRDESGTPGVSTPEGARATIGCDL